MMKKADRHEWIINWLKKNKIGSCRARVDVCDRDFVDDYIDATGASFKAVWYGANKCPTLGRDLAEMVETGELKRHRHGFSAPADGFPKWVWSYRLNPIIYSIETYGE